MSCQPRWRLGRCPGVSLGPGLVCKVLLNVIGWCWKLYSPRLAQDGPWKKSRIFECAESGGCLGSTSCRAQDWAKLASLADKARPLQPRLQDLESP